MKICHEGIYKAFERVCTRNVWKSKQDVWFDYYDGVNNRHAFTIRNKLGQNGVHRAKFLDEMFKLFPLERAKFGKRVNSYTTCAFPQTLSIHVFLTLSSSGATQPQRQKHLFHPTHPILFVLQEHFFFSQSRYNVQAQPIIPRHNCDKATEYDGGIQTGGYKIRGHAAYTQ